VKGRTTTEAGEIATQEFQRFAEFACSEIALGDDASYIYC